MLSLRALEDLIEQFISSQTHWLPVPQPEAAYTCDLESNTRVTRIWRREIGPGRRRARAAKERTAEQKSRTLGSFREPHSRRRGSCAEPRRNDLLPGLSEQTDPPSFGTRERIVDGGGAFGDQDLAVDLDANLPPIRP
jgi:hypothetical protein